MKPCRFAFFHSSFLILQFCPQAQAFFIFRLRRAVLLHTKCAGIHPKRKDGNYESKKSYDIPKHFFSYHGSTNGKKTDFPFDRQLAAVCEGKNVSQIQSGINCRFALPYFVQTLSQSNAFTNQTVIQTKAGLSSQRSSENPYLHFRRPNVGIRKPNGTNPMP